MPLVEAFSICRLLQRHERLLYYGFRYRRLPYCERVVSTGRDFINYRCQQSSTRRRQRIHYVLTFSFRLCLVIPPHLRRRAAACAGGGIYYRRAVAAYAEAPLNLSSRTSAAMRPGHEPGSLISATRQARRHRMPFIASLPSPCLGRREAGPIDGRHVSSTLPILNTACA